MQCVGSVLLEMEILKRLDRVKRFSVLVNDCFVGKQDVLGLDSINFSPANLVLSF